MQVCSVILPGREKRHSERLYTQIEPMADAIARELKPWLDMPYAVFGHSMGALLAVEWMRRVQHEKCSMPAWLFLSGRRAPNVEGDTSLLHSLPDDEFLKELKHRYEGVSEEIMRTPELVEFYLPILRADISVVESYRFREDEPLDCPITVFAGMNDPSITWDQMFAWKRQTRRRFACAAASRRALLSQRTFAANDRRDAGRMVSLNLRHIHFSYHSRAAISAIRRFCSRASEGITGCPFIACFADRAAVKARLLMRSDIGLLPGELGLITARGR